jgi:hypothetical protein
MSEKSDQRKAVRMLKKAGFHVSKGKRMDLTTLLLKYGASGGVAGLADRQETTDKAPEKQGMKEKSCLQKAVDLLEAADFHVDRAYYENVKDTGGDENTSRSTSWYPWDKTGGIWLRITPVDTK